MYDKLVAKVNNTDTSGFVLKTRYDADKLDLELKIPDTSGLAKKTNYSANIIEIEGKIPSISGLLTNAALTAAKNKTPDVTSLVKKQIITRKYQTSRRVLLIMIIINILLL